MLQYVSLSRQISALSKRAQQPQAHSLEVELLAESIHLLHADQAETRLL